MDLTKDDLELLAAGLLGGKATLGQNLGQGLLMMRQGRSEREDRAARQQAMQTQQEMQRMQLEQARQQMGDQTAIRNAYQGAFQPEKVTPFNADQFPGEAPLQGLSTVTPPKMDFGRLQSGLMSAGPAGFQEAARVAQMQQKQQPKFADINPKDFTPESVRKFQQTGSYGDLQSSKPQSGAIADLNAMMDAAGISNPAQRQQIIAQALTKKTTHQPAVSVNTSQEKAEKGAFGSYLVKDMYAPAQDRAKALRKENSLLSALEANPIDTNAAAPLTSTASAWLSSAGIGGEQLKQIASNSQMFNAVAKDLVLQKQLAQKGPQTDSDAKRLEMTVASLGNTKEANRAIIKYAKALNNYDIQFADFLRDYRSKTGSLEGAEEAWFAGPGSRSIWDDPLLKGYSTNTAAPQTGGFSIRKLP